MRSSLIKLKSTLFNLKSLSLLIVTVAIIAAVWKNTENIGRLNFKNFELVPISGCPFGFEVIGLNLSLAKTFSSETRQELIWAIQNYLLLFRNQSLTPLQQIEFTRLFGEIDYLGPPQNNQLGHPLLSSYVMRVANDKTQGYTRVGRYWHNDGTMRSQQSKYSIWYMLKAAEQGGQTHFSPQCKAFELASNEIKEVWRSLMTMHPNGMVGSLIRPHPYTGKECIYFNLAGPTAGLMKASEESEVKRSNIVSGIETRDILQDIVSRLDALSYKHDWKTGDVIMVEGFSLMHKAIPSDAEKDGLRILHRTSVEGDINIGTISTDFRISGVEIEDIHNRLFNNRDSPPVDRVLQELYPALESQEDAIS